MEAVKFADALESVGYGVIAFAAVIAAVVFVSRIRGTFHKRKEDKKDEL